jgi:cell division protein FtsI/penicillin-binding protein 2
VVQDVHSGALVAFASSAAIDAKTSSAIQHSRLDVTSPILPLSLSKVFLASSWWDHESEAIVSKTCKSKECMSDADVHELLVSGLDSAGKRLALELRQAVGGEKVLQDLRAYGFPAAVQSAPGADENFWGEIEANLRDQLTPASSYVSVRKDAADEDWASAFSIGETGFRVTLLHISRFLQAVGNGGVMVPPIARIHDGVQKEDRTTTAHSASAKKVMLTSTAKLLQSAMLDNVQRGSGTGILGRMGNDWKIGGKTGTNSDPDGIFAGLVFDPQGRPRYAFATYVKRGGKGGGVAAEISADLMKFIIGN